MENIKIASRVFYAMTVSDLKDTISRSGYEGDLFDDLLSVLSSYKRFFEVKESEHSSWKIWSKFSAHNVEYDLFDFIFSSNFEKLLENLKKYQDNSFYTNQFASQFNKKGIIPHDLNKKQKEQFVKLFEEQKNKISDIIHFLSESKSLMSKIINNMDKSVSFLNKNFKQIAKDKDNLNYITELIKCGENIQKELKEYSDSSKQSFSSFDNAVDVFKQSIQHGETSKPQQNSQTEESKPEESEIEEETQEDDVYTLMEEKNKYVSTDKFYDKLVDFQNYVNGQASSLKTKFKNDILDYDDNQGKYDKIINDCSKDLKDAFINYFENLNDKITESKFKQLSEIMNGNYKEDIKKIKSDALKRMKSHNVKELNFDEDEQYEHVKQFFKDMKMNKYFEQMKESFQDMVEKFKQDSKDDEELNEFRIYRTSSIKRNNKIAKIAYKISNNFSL